MEQVAVTKITSDNGKEESRNMMLPLDIWNKIVSGDNPEKNVKWVLRKVEPIISVPIEIIQENIKEIQLIAKPPIIEEAAEPIEEIKETVKKPVAKKEVAKPVKKTKRW